MESKKSEYRLQGYLSAEVGDAFIDWKSKNGIGSNSQAIQEILRIFFGMGARHSSQEDASSSPISRDEIKEMIEDAASNFLDADISPSLIARITEVEAALEQVARPIIQGMAEEINRLTARLEKIESRIDSGDEVAASARQEDIFLSPSIINDVPSVLPLESKKEKSSLQTEFFKSASDTHPTSPYQIGETFERLGETLVVFELGEKFLYCKTIGHEAPSDPTIRVTYTEAEIIKVEAAKPKRGRKPGTTSKPRSTSTKSKSQSKKRTKTS